jgi:hypothetical protein
MPTSGVRRSGRIAVVSTLFSVSSRYLIDEN